MQSEINELKKRVERLTKESDKWRSMYADTLTKYKDAEIREAFSTLQSLRERHEAEINSVKMRKQVLKAELKNGIINDTVYQRTLTPLNKQIKDLELKVSTKKHEIINKYLSEGIDYATIQTYMSKKNNI